MPKTSSPILSDRGAYHCDRTANTGDDIKAHRPNIDQIQRSDDIKCCTGGNRNSDASQNNGLKHDRRVQ